MLLFTHKRDDFNEGVSVTPVRRARLWKWIVIYRIGFCFSLAPCEQISILDRYSVRKDLLVVNCVFHLQHIRIAVAFARCLFLLLFLGLKAMKNKKTNTNKGLWRLHIYVANESTQEHYGFWSTLNNTAVTHGACTLHIHCACVMWRRLNQCILITLTLKPQLG